MNVWIMNLKDTRDDKPENLSNTKFDFCKQRNIVGIGWASEESQQKDDIGFKVANDAIDSFEIGDLVWVKNPDAESESEKYYLCEITGKSQITDNEEMNKNDIGKYCTCKFYQVSNLSNNFDEERLTAVHTIEKASEIVQEKTKSIFESFNNNEKAFKKKICIISIICILIIGILTPNIIKFINKKTHPILPENFEFGMVSDKMANDISVLYHYPITKSYSALPTAEGEKNFFANYPLNIKNGELSVLFLSFNENKELYNIGLAVISDKIEDTDFKVLCDYYKKAFGKIEIIKDTDGKKIAIFENNGITCTIYERSLNINITDENYSPKIPEISKAKLCDALNSLNYNVSGYTIKLSTLLNKCVSNMDIEYCSIRDAVYKLHTLNISDSIVENLEKNYTEYAATSYLITVHGDVCQNPDLPYLKREDVDAIKLVLIFDDYKNLIDHIVLERCEDLNTYAILTMFG